MRVFYLHARTAPPWVRSIIWVDNDTGKYGCMTWNRSPPRYVIEWWSGVSNYGPRLKLKRRL